MTPILTGSAKRTFPLPAAPHDLFQGGPRNYSKRWCCRTHLPIEAFEYATLE